MKLLFFVITFIIIISPTSALAHLEQNENDPAFWRHVKLNEIIMRETHDDGWNSEAELALTYQIIHFGHIDSADVLETKLDDTTVWDITRGVHSMEECSPENRIDISWKLVEHDLSDDEMTAVRVAAQLALKAATIAAVTTTGAPILSPTTAVATAISFAIAFILDDVVTAYGEHDALGGGITQWAPVGQGEHNLPGQPSGLRYNILRVDSFPPGTCGSQVSIGQFSNVDREDYATVFPAIRDVINDPDGILERGAIEELSMEEITLHKNKYYNSLFSLVDFSVALTIENHASENIEQVLDKFMESRTLVMKQDYNSALDSYEQVINLAFENVESVTTPPHLFTYSFSNPVKVIQNESAKLPVIVFGVLPEELEVKLEVPDGVTPSMTAVPFEVDNGKYGIYLIQVDVSENSKIGDYPITFSAMGEGFVKNTTLNLIIESQQKDGPDIQIDIETTNNDYIPETVLFIVIITLAVSIAMGIYSIRKK